MQAISSHPSPPGVRARAPLTSDVRSDEASSSQARETFEPSPFRQLCELQARGRAMGEFHLKAERHFLCIPYEKEVSLSQALERLERGKPVRIDQTHREKMHLGFDGKYFWQKEYHHYEYSGSIQSRFTTTLHDTGELAQHYRVETGALPEDATEELASSLKPFASSFYRSPGDSAGALYIIKPSSWGEAGETGLSAFEAARALQDGTPLTVARLDLRQVATAAINQDDDALKGARDEVAYLTDPMDAQALPERY